MPQEASVIDGREIECFRLVIICLTLFKHKENIFTTTYCDSKAKNVVTIIIQEIDLYHNLCQLWHIFPI